MRWLHMRWMRDNIAKSHLTRWLCKSHLAWVQGGKVVSCGCEVTLQISPLMAILTMCRKSHLMPSLHVLMSSCLCHHAKVTSHGHSHHAWEKSPHTYLTCPHVELSSPPRKSDHSHLARQPHLTSTSHGPLHAKIISFTLGGKNSQKSHAANPIPSIRYLLRATN